MKKTFVPVFATAFLLGSTMTALADPILGNWKTEAGSTAKISKCGGSFCVKLVDGTHAGKTIGRMKSDGNGYAGTITDPADNKEYSGSATIRGSTLRMKGCVLSVLCRTQRWSRL